MHRVRLVVRGVVQGVGFRRFVEREARARSVAGWVRNRADGAVEVEAEGETVVLERLIEALRRGPVGARVVSVDASWAEGEAVHHGFTVRVGG
ncbi:MAG: acylphosphatase [Candidatus Eisenbacteria bacterium]|uniref:Acylphosphatase n=1 Tax=Eiseniibacteriota bacterium TaxID=2212470 RepID=A0A9D6L911_UNCEI|nr:acylphosphatase [Candidatus Eisenbacteria bacterium]MBI3539117.1 acylphosphatase [Candidatus Eisenbacteria bacterium]